MPRRRKRRRESNEEAAKTWKGRGWAPQRLQQPASISSLILARAIVGHFGGAQLEGQAVEHGVHIFVAVGAAKFLASSMHSLSTTRQGTSGQFWNS